ncbi:MAG: hypothetical protein H7222_08305 [Methylotenera sp.]|nr:hypothetical protein [Oligoflexia bacterium]
MKFSIFLKTAFTFTSLLAGSALADQQLKLQEIHGGGAADLLNNTTYSPDHPATVTKSGLRISASCTDSSGLVLREKDPGYEACLSQAQSARAQKINGVRAIGTQPAAGAQLQFGN